MPFVIEQTAIESVMRILPRRFEDERGWFCETFKSSDFQAFGIPAVFLQDNHSVSAAGTVRGLHYQLPPHDQGKLVRVVAGRVWDVAVDIRCTSKTFGRWVAAELSAENGAILWVPPGFAHGFVALEDNTHLVYKCTAEYHKPSERAIRWNDPDLAIDWPLVGNGRELLVSAKDHLAPLFADAEVFA